MEKEFVTLTNENIDTEHLCCIIRTKKPHPGVEKKRKWLRERLSDGHVFRKLDAKGCAFIEYAPLEKAWVPIEGENYYYIYCLGVTGDLKGTGTGNELLASCIADAKENGKSGICMLGAKKQKAWLSDQTFAKKYGFVTVDETDSGYELLSLSFDGATPRFCEIARQEKIDSNDLTVYYDFQCPFILQRVESLRSYCEEKGIPASFIEIDSLEKAKNLPCVFNNFAVFYKGKLETVNQIDQKYIDRLLKR